MISSLFHLFFEVTEIHREAMRPAVTSPASENAFVHLQYEITLLGDGATCVAQMTAHRLNNLLSSGRVWSWTIRFSVTSPTYAAVSQPEATFLPKAAVSDEHLLRSGVELYLTLLALNNSSRDASWRRRILSQK